MGVTLVAAVGIILGNLLADIIMPLADPKMRVD
jgi:ABC-type dipeptide/oligopeptide/nickel transport system permease component